MKITNVAAATAILEHRGKRMLFDPWLDDGIFHGAWYHFPPCKMEIADLGRFDYIYISHIHEDHCSEGTIRHLNRDAEIILMDREPRLVEKFLQANDFRFKKIHRVKPRTPTEIAPGLTADMVTADPAHKFNFVIDSGLILNWDGFTVYNANDCGPYPESLDYIKSRHGKIDLALLPYTGGSGYPGCYQNLSADEKAREVKRISEQGMAQFMNAYAALKPSRVMPFADQYVIAGSRASLNEHLAHPASAGVVADPMAAAGESEHLLLLNSGQSFDFDSGKKAPDAPFYRHTDEDRARYIRENLLDKRYDHERFPLNPAVAIERLFKYARARLWEMQERDGYFPEFTYYFDVKDRKRLFKIDLRVDKVEELPYDSPRVEPRLTLICPFTLFVFMLLGHISWNIADAALFIDYERVPNVYDPKLFAFVNYVRI